MNVFSTVVLIIFFCKVWCKLEPISNDFVRTRVSMAKCVGGASRLFFNEGDLTVVSLSVMNDIDTLGPIAGDALIMHELHTRNNMSFIIKKTSSPSYESYIKTINNYILQIRASDEIAESLEVLRGFLTWNSQAKFLVISASIFPDPESVANEILKQLWKKNVFNAVVLLPEPNNTIIFKAYSAYPSWETSCDITTNDITIIDDCSNGILKMGKNWYPNKIPRNLNGCSLKVFPVIWPPYVLPPELGKFVYGIEVMLLNTIAEVTNFSLIYMHTNKTPKWGDIYENGTAYGPLLKLKNEHCDLVIGSFSATNERNAYFDYALYNFRETLTWCVPHAKDTDKWMKLLMVLPVDILIANYVFCIAVGLCMWGLCSYQPTERTTYKSFTGGLLNSFAILNNIPVKAHPKYFKARLLFILWVLFSIHITAVYESSLISTLTKPKYKQQINSLKDILDNNLTIWVMENNMRYLGNPSDAHMLRVNKLAKDCHDIMECLYDTAINRHSATCTPRHFIEFALQQYASERQPLLHCFKNSIVSLPLEMLFVKGFPFTHHFRRLISQITASGLISYWEKQVYSSQIQNKANSLKHGKEYRLGMSNLLFIFVVLLGGYICSFIVLIIELCIKRWSDELK